MIVHILVIWIAMVNVMSIILLRGFLNDLLYNGVQTSKADIDSVDLRVWIKPLKRLSLTKLLHFFLWRNLKKKYISFNKTRYYLPKKKKKKTISKITSKHQKLTLTEWMVDDWENHSALNSSIFFFFKLTLKMFLFLFYLASHFFELPKYQTP